MMKSYDELKAKMEVIQQQMVDIDIEALKWFLTLINIMKVNHNIKTILITGGSGMVGRNFF